MNPDAEAAALYFLAQGLVAPLLVGMLTPGDARAILRLRLDQTFRERPVDASP